MVPVVVSFSSSACAQRHLRGSRTELIELLIADFKDAFWLIPLRANVRRYFVGRPFNKYFVYLRTAQGSCGAPISWAAVAGLVVRLTQNLFT